MAYFRLPLVAKILLGAILGLVAGWMLGPRADGLKPIADLTLQALTLLATPLIFFGLFHAILTAEIKGRLAGRLSWLMLSNSVAAALIGLLVADAVAPGKHILYLDKRQFLPQGLPAETNPLTELLSRLPRDFVGPFANNDVLGVLLIAISLAVALRLVASSSRSEGGTTGERDLSQMTVEPPDAGPGGTASNADAKSSSRSEGGTTGERDPGADRRRAEVPLCGRDDDRHKSGQLNLKPDVSHAERIANLAGYAKLGLDTVVRMLHWVFEIIPFAVLAVVARIVGTAGLSPFGEMVWFVGAVGLGLALTAAFYAVRLRLSSQVRPLEFIRGASDALLLAFSTASSGATLPVTYECATNQLGISEETASLGVMAGGPVNHDGGALYQVIGAICISQTIGQSLGFAQQMILVGIAVVAAVCTAGIPQAGLVSMVAVFHAVRLPTEWIPFLLPVDWLLDRFRTTINVAGNLTATCIADRRRVPLAG